VAHLSAAVSLLLLEALFMQISGVSLTLTWPRRLCLVRDLLGVMPLLQAFPFPSTLVEVTLNWLSQACMFVYSSMGSGPSSLSCGVFLLPPLLQAFPLLVAGPVPLLLPSLARLFIYSSVRDFPSPHLRHSGRPALFAMCLFCSYCLLLSFSLFPLGGGRSV
jgi:hypothetical protein